MNSCVLVNYGSALNDPPAREAIASFAQLGWNAAVLQATPAEVNPSAPPPGVEAIECSTGRLPDWAGPVQRVNRWLALRRDVQRWIESRRPDVVITFMMHTLAALPMGAGRSFRLLSSVLDVVPLKDTGKFDRFIFALGWKRLRQADVVWSSDRYKAELVQKFGELPTLPIVCHNCPPLNYLPEPSWPRDGWLRAELRRQGGAIGDDGCIVLRAGAVGESGGIEATLEAMRQLPSNFVFLMMGRPTREYRDKLLRIIAEIGLQRRAFFWERPSDEIWKQALLGADIGHLVHGPFAPGRMMRLYELNSSLSNNRLFQYMAAGLPILSYDDPRMQSIHTEVSCFRVLRTSHLAKDTYDTLLALGSNFSARMAMGKAGRQAHKATYHWAKQFAPILRAMPANGFALHDCHSSSNQGVSSVR